MVRKKFQMPHKNFGRVIHCFEIGLHTSQPHQYGNWLWTAAAYLNPEVQIHIHHLPARSLSQTSLLTRPECTPTRPNATLSSPQTCFSSCISLCGERYCWTTSATILASFVLPFYPTNRSRNPLPVVSPSPQPWMTRQLSCCLVSLPGLTCPLPAPPQFILFVAWIFPKCTPGRVTFLGRHRQANTWGALDRCHQRPHQLHLLPSFLSLNLPPHRRALSLCRGRSFCLDPSLQCLPPLSS